MKITREQPEIIRIIYRQEQGDEHYGSCLWAIFDFDPGRGMLNIQSDCGDYAHRWPERQEDFLKLCATMDKDYLIRKLCGKPDEVDTEGTLERIWEYLNDMEFRQTKIVRLMNYLKSELSDCPFQESKEMIEYIVEERWNQKYEVGIDQAWELVQTDYSAWQKRIVDIYSKFIVPELLKIIEERQSEGIL